MIISSWNCVCVPKAMLWAHIQIFSLKCSPVSRENVAQNTHRQSAYGMENMAARRSTRAKLRRLQRWFGKNKYDLSFLSPCYVEYSSINKMAKYDWNTFRNYVAFLAGGVAPGTRRPHHDSELISCYHDAFRTWGNYHNNIVLFYHDSPITRSHFMDPTDRAIKGFYCMLFLALNIFMRLFWRARQMLMKQRPGSCIFRKHQNIFIFASMSWHKNCHT